MGIFVLKKFIKTYIYQRVIKHNILYIKELILMYTYIFSIVNSNRKDTIYICGNPNTKRQKSEAT